MPGIIVDGFGGTFSTFSKGFGATASRTLFITLSRLENSSPPGLDGPELSDFGVALDWEPGIKVAFSLVFASS